MKRGEESDGEYNLRVRKFAPARLSSDEKVSSVTPEVSNKMILTMYNYAGIAKGLFFTLIFR